MLSAISQTNIDKCCMISLICVCNIRKNQTYSNSRMVVTRDSGMRKNGEMKMGRVQTFSYKINNFWGSNV